MTKRTDRALVLAGLISAWIACPSVRDAMAQWNASPTPICLAPGDQRQTLAVPDGYGGAILVWRDARPAASGVYAQRVTRAGVPLWGSDGVQIPGLIGGYYSAAADGQGGVMVAEGFPANPIIAQRLDSNGQAIWPAGGVVIPATMRDASQPELVADGSGGGIVAWLDARGVGCDVYVTRVGSDGSLLWPASGIPIRVGRCDSFWIAYDRFKGLKAISDGSGGAILAWTDYRQSASDIFAQRVDGSGVVQWATNGVPVCDVPGEVKNNPVIDTDGAGGAIIAWHDTRVFQWHVFAQRIDANGNRLWTTDGQVVDATYGGKPDHAIAADGSGGAFFSWASGVTGTSRRYVQRILSSGATLWNPGGLVLSGGPIHDDRGSMVSDGSGGTICTWLQPSGSSYSLFAQRIDGNGNWLWNPGGTVVASGVRLPWIFPSPAINEAAGGLITAWEQDGVNGVDLYAQHVTAGGPTVSVQSGSFAPGLSVLVSPNPSRGVTVFLITSAAPQTAHVTIFDLQGRRVRDLGAYSLGPGKQLIRWDGLDGYSQPVGPGIYLVRWEAGPDARTVRFALVR